VHAPHAVGERRRAGLQDVGGLDLVQRAVAHRGHVQPAGPRGDARAAGIVIVHWSAVLTVAIACVMVAILKGRARIADPYPLPDRDHPTGD